MTFILIARIWFHHLTMGRPKYGTHKRESSNIHSKLIQIILNLVVKGTTSSVEVHRKRSTFGSADFTIQWKRKYFQANQQWATSTIEKRSSPILSLPIEKLMKLQSLKERFPNPSFVLHNFRTQIVSLSLWSSIIKAKTSNCLIPKLRKGQSILQPRWEICSQPGW